ncbi:PadR family transcriptional regulator [Paenibacillus sp. P36]
MEDVYPPQDYIDRYSTLEYNVKQEVRIIFDIKITSELIRGHTDSIILKLLMSGDKYGYEISKLVQVTTGGEYELKEATMYASLKRLEQEENITSYWGDETQGGRRKYYRITDKGQETFDTNKRNWEHAKSILDLFI